MKTSIEQGRQLLQNLLLGFNDSAEAVTNLFNEDAVIEYPYAPSLGTPARLNKSEYHNYLTSALAHMPSMTFSNIKVYPVQDEAAYWAEVHCETTIPSTGKFYEQDYVMYFTVQNGKFSLYREYWNPIPGLKAFGGDEAMHQIFNH